MKKQTIHEGTHPTFVALGITRDLLDQVCDIMDQLTQMLEDGQQRLEPYQASKESDLETLDSAISRLPRKNKLALLAAFARIAELVPDSEVEVEEQIAAFEKSRNALYLIRDDLHTALDGVV